MPDGGGLAATRGIRSASPQTRVLVLTSNLASDDVVPAFEAGALGYQLKEIGGDELLDSLWRVARGERVLHPRLAAALPQLCAGSASPGARVDADLPSPLAGLSGRERDVLLLLADGLSNTAIAERLQIGEATVKTHVGNLLGKLQLADRTQAAVWAWRHGVAGR
jgi:DNA-binding NarL/FixJ family response regulator